MTKQKPSSARQLHMEHMGGKTMGQELSPQKRTYRQHTRWGPPVMERWFINPMNTNSYRYHKP